MMRQTRSLPRAVVRRAAVGFVKVDQVYVNQSILAPTLSRPAFSSQVASPHVADRRCFSVCPSVCSVALNRPQNSLAAAYYRGGTSRGVFFRLDDLPTDRNEWPEIFRGVIGSPDPHGRQLDGLGGGVSSLSKVCVIGTSSHPEADVDYTFVSLGIKDSDVDFSSNCGNLTSAVGPFAVDEGLVPIIPNKDSTATVRIHNTNTSKIIHATFPLTSDLTEAASVGSFAIDGVAGTAARIQLDFVDPAGSRTGKLLPTDTVVNTFDHIPVTCIDVGNPCVFVAATSLDIPPTLTPAEIDAHPTLMARLDSLRRQAGVAMGLAPDLASVPGSVPKIGIVGPPGANAAVDLLVRALSVGQPHRAVPITVALALAAAARVEGSVVHGCVSKETVDAAGVTLGHASGKLLVGARFAADGSVECATVFRTARRIMAGKVFWK